MSRLKIVGYASGSPLSALAMARIARDHRLDGIVIPARRRGVVQRLREFVRGPPLLAKIAPLIPESELEKIRPDVIVVASFPRIISMQTLRTARLGALNVHMSILPRHRGVDPIFWTYWDDDSHAGVTIHWMNERIDAGDIVAQESLPLVRGQASRETYHQLSSCGVGLLSGALDGLASGQMPRRPQEESLATYKSAADTTRARIPIDQWPAERVWHVLSGLGDQRDSLLEDANNRPIKHARATCVRHPGTVEPGRIDCLGSTYEIHCSDGIVVVERPDR